MRSTALRGSALPLLVAGAFFMENLDATVIVTAMPQMASTFSVHPIDMNIGISAYILTVSSLSSRHDSVGKFPDSICGHWYGRIIIDNRYPDT